MEIFITSHEVLAAIICWVLASVVGVWAGYITGRSLWRAVAPHASARIAEALAVVWYILWAMFFTYCVEILVDAALIDLGVGQDQALMLMPTYQTYGYIVLGLCVLVGGVFLARNFRKAAKPPVLSWGTTLWHVVRMPLGLFAAAFVALPLLRIPVAHNKADTAVAVARIEAEHITLADVMGANLPPAPSEAANNATVAGIDKNNNGIRDDVELAIFAKYPNDPKIRAAELQYALNQQIFITEVNNAATWVAQAEEESRGYQCISDSVPNSGNLSKDLLVIQARAKEVEDLVFNTPLRVDAKTKADSLTTSFGDLVGVNDCDIDLNTLPQ